jgi:hypothetical protein
VSCSNQFVSSVYLSGNASEEDTRFDTFHAQGNERDRNGTNRTLVIRNCRAGISLSEGK